MVPCPRMPLPATLAAAFCSLGSPQGLCPVLSPVIGADALEPPFWCIWGWLRAPCSRTCLLDIADSLLLLWHCIFTDLRTPSLLLHLHRRHMERGGIAGKGLPRLQPTPHGTWWDGLSCGTVGASLKVNQIATSGAIFWFSPPAPAALQALSGCAEGVGIIAVVVARQRDLSVVVSGSTSLCWNLGPLTIGTMQCPVALGATCAGWACQSLGH